MHLGEGGKLYWMPEHYKGIFRKEYKSKVSQEEERKRTHKEEGKEEGEREGDSFSGTR